MCPYFFHAGAICAYFANASKAKEILELSLMDEILTASQVADLLQIHPPDCLQVGEAGSVPGRKFGEGWRVSRSEIITMISPQGAGEPFPRTAEERYATGQSSKGVKPSDAH